MTRCPGILIFFTLCLPFATAFCGEPADSLLARIRDIEREYGVHAGVSAIDGTGKRSFAYRADSLFPTASVIKLPVLVALFACFQEGKCQPDEVIRLDESVNVPGSGILQHLRPGESMQLINLVMLMIILSDNTATNVVIDRLGNGHEERLEAVNGTMRTCGLERTRLLNKPYSFATKKRTPEALRFGIGVSTPAEMTLLLKRLHDGMLVSREASGAMLDILRRQQDHELAARLLPFDTDSTLWIANKTGSLDDVKNDAGLVGCATGSYVYAIFCDESEDTGEEPDNRASLAVARISLELYRAFIRE
jgi:beta-lactamase class A